MTTGLLVETPAVIGKNALYKTEKPAGFTGW
jgi:hypothetical protein